MVSSVDLAKYVVGSSQKKKFLSFPAVLVSKFPTFYKTDLFIKPKFMTNPFIKPYITHPDLFSDPSKITFSKKCITFGILYMERLLFTIGIIDMSIQVTATIFEPTTT